MRRSIRMHVDLCADFSRPAPRPSGVIEMDMRRQDVTDVAKLESEFLNPRGDGLKDGFGAGIDQQKLPWSSLKQSDRNDIGCSEVQCINQMNHTFIDKPSRLITHGQSPEPLSKSPVRQERRCFARPALVPALI